MSESSIVEDPSERFETEAPLADVLVPIDAAAERLLRVVQMERLQPLESHQPSELREGCRVPFGRTDVITGREEVTRVETHADAWVIVHLCDDRRELLEGRAERR